MRDDPREWAVWSILAYLFDPEYFGDEDDLREELESPELYFAYANKEIVYDALGIEDQEEN